MAKTGGRKKGTPNKSTLEITARLEALGCDPIKGMALIAMGQETCSVCRGHKELRYVRILGELVFEPDPQAEGSKVLNCVNCLGSGLEPAPAALRGKMFAELAQYVEPKRKAIEITQSDPSQGRYTLEELLTIAASFRIDNVEDAPLGLTGCP